MELEINKRYSTTELTKLMGISASTFRHKKEEYLRSLQAAYIYEVEQQGTATYYTITEKIGEYEKPLRKNQREKTDKVIKKFINEVIEEDPMQTAANINRRAWEFADTNPSEIVLLGLKDSTTGEYIRLNLKEMYGTQVNEGGTDGIIEKKVWCRLDYKRNAYVEMTPEMVQKYFDCFNEIKKGQTETDVAIFADYKSGLITRQEMRDRLENQTANVFKEGNSLFYSKYGYYPVRVPVYLKNAWTKN